MIYTHSCGHPLWMEQKHVGGGGDVPWYWNQRPIHQDSVRTCPGCGEKLPSSIVEHAMSVQQHQLVAQHPY